MYLNTLGDVRRLVRKGIADYESNASQLARYAGCCRGTVVRLIRGETKSPHWMTVQKILVALGYKVQVVERWDTLEPTDERLPKLFQTS